MLCDYRFQCIHYITISAEQFHVSRNNLKLLSEFRKTENVQGQFRKTDYVYSLKTLLDPCLPVQQ